MCWLSHFFHISQVSFLFFKNVFLSFFSNNYSCINSFFIVLIHIIFNNSIKDDAITRKLLFVSAFRATSARLHNEENRSEPTESLKLILQVNSLSWTHFLVRLMRFQLWAVLQCSDFINASWRPWCYPALQNIMCEQEGTELIEILIFLAIYFKGWLKRAYMLSDCGFQRGEKKMCCRMTNPRSAFWLTTSACTLLILSVVHCKEDRSYIPTGRLTCAAKQ